MRLDDAAGTLGANGPWIFLLITLPLAPLVDAACCVLLVGTPN
jgi:hypothetical protein